MSTIVRNLDISAESCIVPGVVGPEVELVS